MSYLNLYRNFGKSQQFQKAFESLDALSIFNNTEYELDGNLDKQTTYKVGGGGIV